MIAKRYPQLLNKLVIISGNYKVDGIKKWFRKIITIFTILLTPFTKSFYSAKIQISKFDLILNDIGISEIDLKQINVPTLILGAENDLIYEEHVLNIHHNIRGSLLKIIKKTTHFNIISNIKIIRIIEEFLN